MSGAESSIKVLDKRGSSGRSGNTSREPFEKGVGGDHRSKKLRSIWKLPRFLSGATTSKCDGSRLLGGRNY